MQQLMPTLTKFTRKYQKIINKQENNTNRKRVHVFTPPPPFRREAFEEEPVPFPMLFPFEAL